MFQLKYEARIWERDSIEWELSWSGKKVIQNKVISLARQIWYLTSPVPPNLSCNWDKNRDLWINSVRKGRENKIAPKNQTKTKTMKTTNKNQQKIQTHWNWQKIPKPPQHSNVFYIA